jgi:hypothetical protein
VRLLLETLDIRVSHSCACTWIAMAIDCVCVGSVLYVSVFDGLSLDGINRVISAMVRV